ncbi:MAG: tripartite tricarboxylate transporter substrate binding protein [Eubacteriales bacterium]|jgi:tripartite-type tricarboxylate transporter receptor subunit TctC|nr:tripartite tricarboxylate transporter substrate binding protein [Eubacteriales bacterium]MDD4105612.1 tripartite tricarboxylate transporter substrate binding protein [Eubacteriales bacterium]MDD4710860.1 tripartite tricarboxylate transporter substrate binding protein [Eubacteriales bacterium]NLO14780.1 tripartite tricarboxylate transporter substrate binding protein [Clostridiales bacterium]
MKKLLVFLLVASMLAAPALAAGYPEKGITLIVPWNAGGSSDLIGRLLVADMEQTMGVRISVVNTPGATGTIGMNDAFLAPHDGYTLIANATPYGHGVQGMADWAPYDWDFFAAYYVPGIIAVNKDSEYKTFDDLYQALKNNPDTVTGGTAGVGSTGYVNMEVLKSVDPAFGNYKSISYTGGAAAVTATLAGEVDFTPQLSNEMIDLLRSGDLVALAALTAEDLTLEGLDYTIPSIKTFLPEVESVLPLGDAFGLMFPSDVPQEAKDALEAAYLKATETDAAKAFANEKGVILQGLNLEESNALRDATTSRVTWILYDNGAAPVSPEQFNIPRP